MSPQIAIFGVVNEPRCRPTVPAPYEPEVFPRESPSRFFKIKLRKWQAGQCFLGRLVMIEHDQTASRLPHGQHLLSGKTEIKHVDVAPIHGWAWPTVLNGNCLNI